MNNPSPRPPWSDLLGEILKKTLLWGAKRHPSICCKLKYFEVSWIPPKYQQFTLQLNSKVAQFGFLNLFENVWHTSSRRLQFGPTTNAWRVLKVAAANKIWDLGDSDPTEMQGRKAAEGLFKVSCATTMFLCFSPGFVSLTSFFVFAEHRSFCTVKSFEDLKQRRDIATNSMCRIPLRCNTMSSGYIATAATTVHQIHIYYMTCLFTHVALLNFKHVHVYNVR